MILRKYVALLSIGLICACQTTGNPRDGGLFGWEEGKARQRVARKEQQYSESRAQLAQEQTQYDANLRQHQQSTEQLAQLKEELSRLSDEREVLITTLNRLIAEDDSYQVKINDVMKKLSFNFYQRTKHTQKSQEETLEAYQIANQLERDIQYLNEAIILLSN